MTCIAGIADGKRVVLGADSIGSNSHTKTARADRKVFRNGDFVMGFTSSYRMGQLLRYKFAPPRRHADTDVFAYMVVDFVEAVRTCLKQGGYARSDNGEDSGGTFLVGYQGRLFKIENDFQVGESVDGYDACGSGDEVALGALFATAGQGPHERVRKALEASAHFSRGVGPPFHIEEA